MAIKKSGFVWMDGKFVRWEYAKVHIATHAMLYGSAVFEGIHSYKTKRGTAVFRLGDHIDRLFHSAESFGMSVKFSKAHLKNAVKELVKKNRITDGYIRPMVYYGYSDIGVYPESAPARAAIISIPWKKYFTKNLSVGVSKYVRHSEKSSAFGAKISGNYANSILAMHDARQKGYDEALMLDYRGYVAEGPAENLFIVKNNELITPSSRSALHGITRSTILAISNGMGIKAYEKSVALKEVMEADELFFCGTMMEIAPIAYINRKKVGDGKPGKITSRITEKFYEVVMGNDPKYKKWLDYVG